MVVPLFPLGAGTCTAREPAAAADAVSAPVAPKSSMVREAVRSRASLISPDRGDRPRGSFGVRIMVAPFSGVDRLLAAVRHRWEGRMTNWPKRPHPDESAPLERCEGGPG